LSKIYLEVMACGVAESTSVPCFVHRAYCLLQIAVIGRENSMPGMKDKVVAITGASSGIGEE
jgi:hypothetical protein